MNATVLTKKTWIICSAPQRKPDGDHLPVDGLEPAWERRASHYHRRSWRRRARITRRSSRRLLGEHEQETAQFPSARLHDPEAARPRATIVVPDNVLFEGGAGETVRRELL